MPFAAAGQSTRSVVLKDIAFQAGQPDRVQGTLVTFRWRDGSTPHNVLSRGKARFPAPVTGRRAPTGCASARPAPTGTSARSIPACPAGSSSADQINQEDRQCPIKLDLDTLDVDGAVRESAEAAGLDRSDFIKKGVLAGGGLLVGTALFTQYRRSGRRRDLHAPQVRRQRREDPQLRADARVPRGRVLPGRPSRTAPSSTPSSGGSARWSRRTRPRTSSSCAGRWAQGDPEAAVRLRDAVTDPTRSPPPPRCSRTRAWRPTSARSPTSAGTGPDRRGQRSPPSRRATPRGSASSTAAARPTRRTATLPAPKTFDTAHARANDPQGGHGTGFIQGSRGLDKAAIASPEGPGGALRRFSAAHGARRTP